MKRNNNFLIPILGEVLFLIIILFIFPVLFIKEKPGISVLNFKDILPLDVKTSYNQKIIIDQNNLQSISLLLKNPQLFNQSSITIDLLDQDKNILRSLKTSGASVGDPNWVNFKFPYIQSKIGDTFFIKITTDNTKLDSIYVYGDWESKSINYKTTYFYGNIKESFKSNLEKQFEKINQMNKIYLGFYSFLIIGLNIIFFKNILR